MALLRTLSGRLFLLTVAIVMMTEAFVFLPSVARFREDFLSQRLQMAQIASLALLAADDAMVEDALERELLAHAEVSTIALKRGAARQLVLRTPLSAPVAETFDLRDADMAELILDALAAMVRTEERLIRVIGAPSMNPGEEVDITLNEAPLCREIQAFGQRILLLSLLISTVTGLLIFLVSRRLIVRPMQRVIDQMEAIQRDPEGAPAAGRARSGLSEIARAETVLGEMQAQIRGALRQKTRLAQLGLAVAKISHDLRNMLSSAQLMADRLEASRDPVVARIAPKLIGSIDRAVTLCVSTLRHGKAEEAPPVPRRVALGPLIAEVGEAVFDEDGPVGFAQEAPPGAEALVDPEHLFRILTNLARNARQAIEASGRAGRVTIVAEDGDGAVSITVRDDGPGMPAKAMETLFQPFIGSASRGGSGLGLAIAAELAASNGGRLELVGSTTAGTVFRLTLPR